MSSAPPRGNMGAGDYRLSAAAGRADSANICADELQADNATACTVACAGGTKLPDMADRGGGCAK